MIRNILTALLMLASAPLAAETYRDRAQPMSVVAGLDLNRYLGKWYEIARFPNRFEKNCVGVTAEYALRTDGQISVTNTCRKGTLSGPVEQAVGSARIEGPGRLSVTFVPWLPFARGDYWVLYLDTKYTVAAVGSPKGTTGWILARTPQISSAARAKAEAALVRNGYDISKLETVLQPSR